MKTILILASCALLAGVAGTARAQPEDPVLARLSAEKTQSVEPGLYNAGEGRDFSLTPYRGRYLLRFSGSAENFVLTMDAASLGGKLLKYDTGVTALRVPVWGGLTLYLSDAPDGLPAERQGDAVPAAAPAPVSVAALQAALADEAAHFSYADNLTLHFTADAAALAGADARALAFDTLANIQVGIERFLAGATQARQALARRVTMVRIEAGPHAAITLSGHDLKVSFTPADGYLGRASSHAVAHQLGKLLSVDTPE